MNLGFTCNTPVNECRGSFVVAGPGKGKVKYHGDPKQVRRCQARYLEGQGYTRIGQREFRHPDKGVLVLDKRPSPPVVTGKGGEKGGRGRAMVRAHTVNTW